MLGFKNKEGSILFCLCHAFHRHTLSQHNSLGHLKFLLPPQCTQVSFTSSKGTNGSPKMDAHLLCMTLHCHILVC